MTDVLRMFTVCFDTADFPGQYTCRGHIIERGYTVPEMEVLVSSTYAPIRNEMVRRGLTKLPRSPQDEKVIVESWI